MNAVAKEGWDAVVLMRIEERGERGNGGGENRGTVKEARG